MVARAPQKGILHRGHACQVVGGPILSLLFLAPSKGAGREGGPGRETPETLVPSLGSDWWTAPPPRLPPIQAAPLGQAGEGLRLLSLLWVSCYVNHMGLGASPHLTEEAAEAQREDTMGRSGGLGQMASLRESSGLFGQG